MKIIIRICLGQDWRINMSSTKRGFFADIAGMFKGLVKPSEYIRNGKEGTGGAALLLALIFALLVPFFTMYLPVNSKYGNGKVAKLVDESLVDFELTAEGFSCDEVYIWDDSASRQYICIDTSRAAVDRDEFNDLIYEQNYVSIIYATGTEVAMYSDNSTQFISWKDIYNYCKSVDGKTMFSKDYIIELIEKYDTPVIVITYIFFVVFSFIGFMLCGLIWALIGLIFNAVFGTKISFGSLFNASIYIRAIWYLVKKLLTTFVVSGMGTLMWTIFFVVILVYLGIAVYQYGKNNPVTPMQNIPMPDNGQYGQQAPNTQAFYGGQQIDMSNPYNSVQNNANNPYDGTTNNDNNNFQN